MAGPSLGIRLRDGAEEMSTLILINRGLDARIESPIEIIGLNLFQSYTFVNKTIK